MTANSDQAPSIGPAPSIRSSARPAFCWPMLGIMLAFIAGANLLWYRFFYHTRSSFWTSLTQPLWILIGALLFFLLLRLFRGIRPTDLSKSSWIVLISSYLLFASVWLFGRTGSFQDFFGPSLGRHEYFPIYAFGYFSLNCLIARTVIPLAINRWWLHRRPADIGYRLRGTFDLWWVYLVLATAVIGVVVLYASRQVAFQHKYPMCPGLIDHATVDTTKFLFYQALYSLIFVSGESFWRGYILFSLERDLGYLALLYMIIPYTAAHYGKPLPETMGAAVTGLVLGYLALRHRSFWLGVLAHYAVALSMDLASLWRQAILFS